MSNQHCERIVSAIAKQPWAITEDALELILGIAQRQVSDPQAVLAAPALRRESGSVAVRDGVAIISVMGPIFPRADFFTQISGATSVETLALRFGEAVAAKDVKGIVLHIDSPGGQTTGIHEFASQIFAARSVKPVVAYASGMCTSAAYWLGSAAQRVVADETADLGSIGVVSAWTDDTEARKAKGLTDYEVVSSQSPNKRLDPTSEAGRTALQRRLDGFADIFIADVARHRAKSTDYVAANFGQGGIMLAAEAVRVGMADAIGSLEGVIASLAGGGSTLKINKEICMDEEQLAKEHPALLAQVTAKAEAAGAAKAAQQGKDILALAGIVAGEEVANKLEALVAAGVTPAMAQAMAGTLGLSVPQAAGQEAIVEAGQRKEILQTILSATPNPLDTTAAVSEQGDAVAAAVDRISKIGVKG